LRNFIRDFGTQLTLGVFVATFVFAILTLGAIGGGSGSDTFVPQISVTVALGLVLISVIVLIYFIHHITISIQLPGVMSSIAANLAQAIDVQFPVDGIASAPQVFTTGRSREDLTQLLASEGSEVTATKS